MLSNNDIAKSMQIHLGDIFEKLPHKPKFVPGIRRAPARHFKLNHNETDWPSKMRCVIFRQNGINPWRLNFWTSL